MFNQILVRFVALLALAACAYGVELTFELPDSAEQCFYEEITRGTKSTIEYQVSYLSGWSFGGCCTAVRSVRLLV